MWLGCVWQRQASDLRSKVLTLNPQGFHQTGEIYGCDKRYIRRDIYA